MRQGNDVGTQYRSAIYTFSQEQMEAALRSKEEYQKMDVIMPAEKIDGIFGKNQMSLVVGDSQLPKQTRTIGWGFEHPGPVEGAPAHGRGVGPDELSKSIPTQTIL
ncbi:hypothetical protein DUI87_05631 [Hirundo rustica rustica]|uniref:peptide-methionine (S)-S-oxide reductase n=1 Tax=Hirundo rustica rustica TaxID=333673 RepID=A0A3M0KV29_HIRRU|nr:hypothetical protein DUI87_05631 [Hirundo rustica rustica]